MIDNPSKKIIVFDFDKTLTKSDSFNQFLIIASKKNFVYPFKLVRYFFLIIQKKIGFISLELLKERAMNLFFYDEKNIDLDLRAKSFSKKIKLNKVYYEDYFIENKNSRVIISTASPSLYMQYFDFNEFHSSYFDFDSKYGFKLLYHNHGENKLKTLLNSGINAIDCLYTDSVDDEPLARIASKIILVQNGKKKKFDSYNDFINGF